MKNETTKKNVQHIKMKEKNIIIMEEKGLKKNPRRRSQSPKQNGTALRFVASKARHALSRLVRTHIQIEYVVLLTLLILLVIFLYQIDPAGTQHREDKRVNLQIECDVSSEVPMRHNGIQHFSQRKLFHCLPLLPSAQSPT